MATRVYRDIEIAGKFTLSNFTDGSVLFVDPNGVVSEDNGKLCWDATNSSLGVGTNTPGVSTVLDISSTTKGLLPPQMTTAQRNAIVTPANGLVVDNSTDNRLQRNSGTSSTPVWSSLSSNPFSFVTGTTDTTVGVSETDMPEMSLSIISEGSPISFDFWVGYSSLVSTHNTTFVLYRDSTVIRKWGHTTQVLGRSDETGLHWVDQPVAGTYTYKITWFTDTDTSRRNASTNTFEGSILSATLTLA